MSFKYRYSMQQECSAEECDEGEHLYQQHLVSKKNVIPAALWKYFSTDSFHDGCIKHICFKNKLKKLELRMECPNIQIAESSEAEYSYVSLDYICLFRHVVKLDFAYEGNSLAIDPFSDAYSALDPEYLHCEIDTLDKDIAEAEKSMGRLFHSIVINLANSFTFVSVVFADVEVVCAELGKHKDLVDNNHCVFPWDC